MLLDAGAQHSAASPGTLSALHLAALSTRLDVVEVLLARGAKVSEIFSSDAAIDSFHDFIKFGGTALHLCAVSMDYARSMKKEFGSKLEFIQPDLVSAQETATRRAAVCAALLHAGADVDAVTTPHAVLALPEHKLTPLMLASQCGDTAVIKVLLRAGAQANYVEMGTGHTSLHFAACNGCTDAIYARVAGGADVDPLCALKKDDELLTPLAMAVTRNHHGAVRALLELGASSSKLCTLLSAPRALVLPNVDDKTHALMSRHQRGDAPAPARACSLPDCEARRRADYDDKRLMACPCKVRAAASAVLLCRTVVALALPHAMGVSAQLAYYCCKEHQLLDRARHKKACKAALAKQAS